MVFKEINGDLFKSDDKYTLVHCISSDCAMGAGIAKTFDSKMPDMKNQLKSNRYKIKVNLNNIVFKDEDKLLLNRSYVKSM